MAFEPNLGLESSALGWDAEQTDLCPACTHDPCVRESERLAACYRTVIQWKKSFETQNYLILRNYFLNLALLNNSPIISYFGYLVFMGIHKYVKEVKTPQTLLKESRKSILLKIFLSHN